jgi:hypothetical protein
MENLAAWVQVSAPRKAAFDAPWLIRKCKNVRAMICPTGRLTCWPKSQRRQRRKRSKIEVLTPSDYLLNIHSLCTIQNLRKAYEINVQILPVEESRSHIYIPGFIRMSSTNAHRKKDPK